MNSKEIRKKFLDFFYTKSHEIVSSAPIVVKDDPTLMFTNAGMNQFKNIFLGNTEVKYRRIANSQKCLRVSGKHNDLEEVGIDTYHHTMFEMLGNWSFGDYFKEEAISWAWELLTEVYKIDQSRIYVTIFEGDANDGLEADHESGDIWKRFIAEERILKFSRKDNFWEMGESGPCGPCTEIHVDIRPEKERSKVDGKSLVNKGHPQVIEIWNLVFIQFNRDTTGKLHNLPAKHVDTGMGLERLCMVLQGKTSNYDTDVFSPTIYALEQLSGKIYGKSEKTDIAIRVISDHIRAVCFAIADGQVPSNNGAGYVIKRILRRAVRYGYSFLLLKDPFLFRLVDILADQFKDIFPELDAQKEFVAKVIKEEEAGFLRTIENGLIKFNTIKNNLSGKIISGKEVFELYDTYGFPPDLTRLIAQEEGLEIDEQGFEKHLNEQRERSRRATQTQAGDWIILNESKVSTEFVGYEQLETESQILKYRKVISKNKEIYQLVFDKSPFYPEGGGQVGDTGHLIFPNEIIKVFNTYKENDLIVHNVDRLPENPTHLFKCLVDEQKRKHSERNHSATHLLHAALRKVLGKHVEQKGSLVTPDYLRFDFSHHSKLSQEEVEKIEQLVNEKIREGLEKEEFIETLSKAKKMGALALFGEKYGEKVRIIRFGEDFSTELCGGTHVNNSIEIGVFKIISETSVAAGIRRIEALTSSKALDYINDELQTLSQVRKLLNNPVNVIKSLKELQEKISCKEKQIEEYRREKLIQTKSALKQNMITENNLNIIAQVVDLDAASIKDLSFQLKGEIDRLVLILAASNQGKSLFSTMISDNLISEKNLDARKINQEIFDLIEGSGGGQAFYATAGGKATDKLEKAISKALSFVKSNI